MQTLPNSSHHLAAPKSYTNKDWNGGNEALKEEYDYTIEDIEGTIPPELEGTLYRNVPAMLDVNGQGVKHPFDADGMICAVRFQKGKAHFRNRYVRTEGYLKELETGEFAYRGVFGTQKPGGALKNAFDFRLKNVANTNVIYWGDKLMALWEASHPYRLHPDTLETLGIETLNGVLEEGQPFAAHPMVDPGEAGEEKCLVTFSIKAGLSSKITIYELNEAAEVVKQHSHAVPGFTFIHDFAITPNYCLFFQNPLSFNPLPFVLGLRGAAECIRFLPNKPTKIWVIPRDESQPMKVIETKAGFIFHHANAFEDGDDIIVDSIAYPNFPSVDNNISYKEIDFDQVPPGQLYRFRLNLSSETSQSHCVDERTVEFPYIHPDYIGRQHSWIFMGAVHNPTGNAPMQALLKINPETGEQDLWSAAPTGFIGEPVFVPKPGSTQEDEGWVIVLVYDAEYHRTDVVILEGQNISAGPVARLHLKHHIPYGLHGCFVSA